MVTRESEYLNIDVIQAYVYMMTSWTVSLCTNVIGHFCIFGFGFDDIQRGGFFNI